ncbi:MAG: hypothetical protein D6781_12130 [Verrucomicrobia bacterium]|nr:MAG: hypothetical protein D6781_12130 [Verrucomicrobiota bacterium]
MESKHPHERSQTPDDQHHRAGKSIGYKPSVWYYRRAARASQDPEALRALCLLLCRELELLKSWVRTALGVVPPKWCVLPEEKRDKGWE